jgi:hypothetical protein
MGWIPILIVVQVVVVVIVEDVVVVIVVVVVDVDVEVLVVVEDALGLATLLLLDQLLLTFGGLHRGQLGLLKNPGPMLKIKFCFLFYV